LQTSTKRRHNRTSRFRLSASQQEFTPNCLPVILPEPGPPGFMVLGLRRVLDEWLTCTTGVRLKLKLLAFYDTTSEMQTQGLPARKLLCTFSNAEIYEAETVNAIGEKIKWVWFVVEHQLEEDEKGG